MYGNKFDAQQEPTAQQATNKNDFFGVESVASALEKQMHKHEHLVEYHRKEWNRLLRLFNKTPRHLLHTPSSTVKSLSENL